MLAWLLVIFQLIAHSRWIPYQSLLGFQDEALVFVRNTAGWVPVPSLVIFCVLLYTFFSSSLLCLSVLCYLVSFHLGASDSPAYYYSGCHFYSNPLTQVKLYPKSIFNSHYVLYLFREPLAANCFCSTITFYFSLSRVTCSLKCLFSSHSSHSTLFLSCLQYLV